MAYLPERWVVFHRKPCGRKTQVLVTRKSGIICKYNRFSLISLVTLPGTHAWPMP